MGSSMQTLHKQCGLLSWTHNNNNSQISQTTMLNISHNLQDAVSKQATNIVVSDLEHTTAVLSHTL